MVRIWNPYRGETPANPRKPRIWTYAQAQDRKEKAERAARDLQDDDERGDEIAGMLPEEYAAERGFAIVDNPQKGRKPSNPNKRKRVNTVKREEVVQKLKEELKPVLKDLVTEAVKEARPNPAAAVQRLRHKIEAEELPEDERTELLDKIAGIADAMADGRVDRAQRIAEDLLEEYGYGEEEEGEEED